MSRLSFSESFKSVVNTLASIAGDLKLVRNDIKDLQETIRQYGNVINHNAHITKEAAIITAQDAVILNSPKYQDAKSLMNHQSQVYSQNGEDGIIAEIFNRIGTTNKFFVEIGVENGIECNSRFLLDIGWQGVWIEGSESSIPQIHQLFDNYLANKKLTLVNSFLTRENVAGILEKAITPKEFDFISIDIDMNTHHIWSALSAYSPRVVCVEYNASIPPSVDYSVPYSADGSWDGSNYFGAGLKALERIGGELGYRLVGCDYLGINAFFVQADLCGEKFAAPFSAEFHYEPPRYSLLNHRGHRKHYGKRLDVVT
jgi:hypothetical protein